MLHALIQLTRTLKRADGFAVSLILVGVDRLGRAVLTGLQGLPKETPS